MHLEKTKEFEAPRYYTHKSLICILEPLPPRGGLNMLIRVTADGQKPLEVAAKSIQVKKLVSISII